MIWYLLAAIFVASFLFSLYAGICKPDGWPYTRRANRLVTIAAAPATVPLILLFEMGKAGWIESRALWRDIREDWNRLRPLDLK